MSVESNAESLPLPGRTFSEREALLLAPYAMPSAATRGRRHPEPPHPYRGPFQRDRDRILHCAAYRRLAHKTQVFTGDMGDYHRTRLTHTLEVASVARTIGRALALNEDLIEALALLHDLGHPPFGHAGEATLDTCMADDGGFDHNTHALRIVEHLETRYQNFPGLNLSLEVLEGQAHRAAKDAPHRPLLEVQVVEAADSIAYDAHDADDALQLGLLTLDELLEIPWWREAVDRVRQSQHCDASDTLRRAVVHELIDWQVGDVLDTAVKNLGVKRDNPSIIIHPSDPLTTRKRKLESFLSERVYRHPRVLTMRDRAQDALAAMFDWFVAHADRLPASFQDRIDQVGVRRSVCDYLAGMTDRFALAQHGRLTATSDWPTDLTEATLFGA